MATPIQMWKSADGKTFPTREAADAHDEAVKVMRNLRTLIPTPERHEAIYNILAALLQDWTLVRRVYTEEKP